jgi:hypothetical protein
MATLIRLFAVLACLAILVSFASFVSDQAGGASKEQVGKLGGELGDPVLSPQGEAVRERGHSGPREAIDDANDVLLTPFTGIVDSKDPWVSRAVPTVLGLLAYGVGLMLFANVLPGPRRRSTDWRTA